jgi:tetratricopeptide (TPR) repeat protein
LATGKRTGKLTAPKRAGEENMEKEDAESLALINKGNEFYKDKNYEEAIKCYDKVVLLEPDVISALNQKKAQVFFDWGNALYKSAKNNENESLFKEAFDKYDKAIQYSESDSVSATELDAFANWGDALCDLTKIKPDKILLREVIDKYKEAVQRNEYPWAIVSLGYALYNLAKIEQDEFLFREAIEKYDKVEENDGYYYYYDACIKRGIAIVNLAKIKQDKSLYEEAKECFKKTGKDILDILVYLDRKEVEQIIETEILHPFLNPDIGTDDSNFFNEVIENIKKDISQEELNKYKEIYIRSIFIISQLHINNVYEKSVAYYTKKTIAQELLLNKSKFRLNAIDNSNDPTEGKILLNYLFKDKHSKDEKFETKYRAFASCFTFQHDSLNQFRLYGKDQNQEGTGLSLVFNENFFSKKLKMATGSDKIIKRHPIEEIFNDEDKDEDKKYTLFRCIYIDPKKQQVETVGHKETKDENYKKYIKDIFDIVNEKMKKLKDLITQNPDLNLNVIEHLLLNLRYLTKHVAFKEEQECRIVRICSINGKDEIHFDEDKMFIEYEPYFLYEPGVSYKPKVIPRIEKIYFGPKATNMQLFEDRLTVELSYKIQCEKSENPLA